MKISCCSDKGREKFVTYATFLELFLGLAQYQQDSGALSKKGYLVDSSA